MQLTICDEDMVADCMLYKGAGTPKRRPIIVCNQSPTRFLVEVVTGGKEWPVIKASPSTLSQCTAFV